MFGWLLSAGVYIAAKWANAEMPPWALCFWRLSLACLILLPIVHHHYAANAQLPGAAAGAAAGRRDRPRPICQGLLYMGLQYTNATTAGIIMALAPDHHHGAGALPARRGDGRAAGHRGRVSLAGMVVIVAHGDLAALMALQLNRGELLIVASAVGWGLYTVLLRRFKFDIDRLPLLVLLLGAGRSVAIPFYGLELVQDERSALDGNGLIALAYVAGPGGALMYYLYNRSVDALGATRAGMMLYLQTAFVALLAYLLPRRKPARL